MAQQLNPVFQGENYNAPVAHALVQLEIILSTAPKKPGNYPGFLGACIRIYSHSIVAGGLDEMS